MESTNKRRNYVICTLRCNDCGSKFPILRRKGWLKKNGHIKDLYCYVCKGYTKHTEGSGYDK